MPMAYALCHGVTSPPIWLMAYALCHGVTSPPIGDMAYGVIIDCTQTQCTVHSMCSTSQDAPNNTDRAKGQFNKANKVDSPQWCSEPSSASESNYTDRCSCTLAVDSCTNPAFRWSTRA